MAWVSASLIMAPLALIAVFAGITPLIVHLRAKNFAATLLIMGLTILNIQSFINAIIWHTTDSETWWDGNILCDIEVKLYMGIYQAVDGAIASIFRQVAIILHPDHVAVAPSPRQRKTTWIIELTLCVFLPVYVMVGHYLTQRTRYWVRTSAGCIATFDINYAAPFLTYGWLLVVSMIASVYCIVSLNRLYKHRKQMSLVISHTPGATTSRFYRLLAFASGLLVIYGPLSIYAFTNNLRIHMHTYSWSHIHPPDWSKRIFFGDDAGVHGQYITFDRWALVLTAYLAFAFFGLGQEATEMYKSWIRQATNFFHKTCTRNNETSGCSAQGMATYEMQTTVAAVPNQDTLVHNKLTHIHNSNISELSGSYHV